MRIAMILLACATAGVPTALAIASTDAPSVAAHVSASAAAVARERRCGWIVNPTPGNYWLNDRHGGWTISAQGGYQAQGMDTMPDFSAGGWVRTNGSYGYGCACMNVDTNARGRRITRIHSAQSVPLAQCRRDRNLRRPS